MAGAVKKAMVYLGLAEEEESAPQQQKAAPMNVTPIRRVPHTSPKAAMNEISTFHPQKYSEAQQIVERFRQGIPVIIDMSLLSDVDARRMIDFASGLSQGLQGKIERVVGKVFLLSPEHVVVSTGAPESQEK